MSCLQHKFVPHATLQRWLFCEYCGAAQELGVAAGKEERPKVVKRKDVDDSLKRVLPEILAQMAGEAPEPQQQELFTPPHLEGDDFYARRQAQQMAEATARAGAANLTPDDIPPGYFDPNAPNGLPWTSTIRSS